MESKFETVTNIIKVYAASKNEWFINYKLSLYLFIVGFITFSAYILVGNFSLFNFFYKIVLILMFGHIVLSMLAVINDYVFNTSLKAWFKCLWVLISFRLILEVLLW